MQGLQLVLSPVVGGRPCGVHAFALPVQFLDLQADLRHIVPLKLQESLFGLLFQRLQFVQLPFLRPAFRRDRLQGLPDPGLHIAQVCFRHRAAAGGADDPGLEALEKRRLPAVLGAQFLDLCGGLRDVPGVLGCVLLGAPLAQFAMEFLEPAVDLRGVHAPGTVLGHFIIAGAQFHQPLLHTGQIEAGKAFFLQRVPFPDEGIAAILERAQVLRSAGALGVQQILLPVEVNDILLQVPNLLPAPLQIGLRGEDGLVLQRGPHTLGEGGEHLLMGDSGQMPFQQFLPIVPQFLDEIEGIEDGEEHILFTEHLIEVVLADLIAVIGDGHAAFLPGAGQFMVLAFPIHKVHRHH